MLYRSFMMRHAKCGCVPVETATFIFAVFSAVISGLATLLVSTAQIWYVPYTGDDRINQYWDPDPETFRVSPGDKVSNQRILDFSAAMSAFLFTFTCCVMTFIFSVFLCYGTNKRRPDFVKAYLVFGVVVTIVMMTGAVLYSWLMEDIIVGSIILISCGLYSMILLMVQRTYELLRVEQTRTSAHLLCPEHGMKS